MEDNFSTDGEDCSGGNASDGERCGAADEASLTSPLFTSCCAAGFLTGCGPDRSTAQGLGTPDLE